jgi:acetyl/propionyl-CoA carboxylase alpha subunit
MRVVRSERELEEARAAARREAATAFGDDRVYAEAFLEGARHVEVQILGDGRGGVVTLGERDCSVQRRHQKVLEESPSPGVDAATRARLEEAAAALARELRYANAGTVEFLVAGGAIHFIELNARLQVEHPVTELRYGLDLVEAQLRLAAGSSLPAPGEPSGHAIEARLYAEDPVGFLPRGGRVERLELPHGLRVDAGLEAGDEVPLGYDPLIAKLVAAGADRPEALDRLAAGLAATRVGGVTTNLGFLRWLVAHPVVQAGAATTSFLEEHPPLSRRRPPRGPWAGHWRLAGGTSPPPPAAPPAPVRSGHGHGAGASALESPMPGVVLRVLVAEGDEVEAHQPLVLLEAMKMETPIVAPYPATVRRVHVAEGERVDAGTPVAELDA